MDFSILQSCPSCGANIELHEDDRVVWCSFCDSANYKIGGTGDRYTLPLRQSPTIAPEQLIYAPYLRFKGSVFYVKGVEVKHKIIDTTRTACKESHLPISLGVRPQAMVLQPLTTRKQGKFIRQAVPTKEVFRHAATVAELFEPNSEAPVYHRSFVGETISRIYQPYYLLGDEIFDAVDDQLVGQESLMQMRSAAICRSKISWEPQFISMHCPGCGGLLQGEHDSVVQQCGNCQLLWQEQGKRFVPVVWRVVRSVAQNVRYLPFWKMRLALSGVDIRTYGDFLRFTRQPSLAAMASQDEPFYFYFPAFKLNPKAFLQVSCQLTVSQWRLPAGEEKMAITAAYPVLMDHAEARQIYKTVLAATSVAREQCYPLLPKIKLIGSAAELMFLPFQEQSHDVVQEHTGAVIQQAALRFGRRL